MAAPPMPALANKAATMTTGRSAKRMAALAAAAGADSERRKRPRIRWRETPESGEMALASWIRAATPSRSCSVVRSRSRAVFSNGGTLIFVFR